MPDTEVALSLAKAGLSHVVERAEHRGVRTVITRHGRRVAAVVPFDDLQRLHDYERSDSRKTAASLFAEIQPDDRFVAAVRAVRMEARSHLPRKVPPLRRP